MKNRHLLTSSLFLLLILLSATRGNAGTGSCADDPATSCNDTNTCNGATDCAIYISLDDTNRVVVSLQRSGTHQPIICVAPGQTVNWTVADANSKFTVTFSSTTTPFHHYIFNGSSGTPASDSTTNLAAHKCVKYLVQECPQSKDCASLDPKIIVTGVKKKK
jgi:hypothetical protein